MKIKYFLYGMPLVSAALFFNSCGGDDEVVNDGPKVEIDTDLDTKKELSPEDQKEYLEAVALAFMETTPASDFDTYADLANYCTEEFEDYDWDDVEDWADDAWDALLVKRGSHDESEDYGYSSYLYHYTDYDALIAASNFTGHFEGSNGRWRYTKADDLQFSFKDQNGQQVVAKLTTTGGKDVYVGDFEDETYWNYDWDSYNDKYIYETGYDNYKTTIKVPEKINVVVTQAGKEIASTTVNIDLNSLSGKEFTTASHLTLNSETKLSNGYKVNVSQVKYDGKNAEAAFTLSNKSGVLVSGSLSGNASDLPNYNLSDFVNDDFDDDDFDYTTGNLTFVKLNILDKVQFEGAIDDVRSFVENVEDADDNYTDKNAMQKYLNKANKQMRAYVYYGGSNVRQASMTLEAVFEESWDGETCYEIVPVLNFSDGSRYSTFEAFFDEDDFSATIKAFKRLANKYADLLDEVDRPY